MKPGAVIQGATKQVQVISRKRVLDAFWNVDEVMVRYERPDGSLSEPVSRLSMERGDASAVLVQRQPDGALLFVRQFRYPALRHGDPFPIEIVAGAIDDGESPEEAASRELTEEAGYDAKALESIGSFYASVGGSSERVHLFYAEVADGDRTHDGNAIEGEDLELVWLSPEDAFGLLDAGEIRDSKAVIALQWLRLRTG